MDKKRKLIRNYFEKVDSKRPWYFIIGGVVAAYITPGLLVISLVGGILYLLQRKEKATEEQYDNWLDHDIQKFYDEAMKKTRLDESQVVRDPVMMIGPRWQDLGGAEIHRKKSKDGKTRHTPLSITVINFTEHQLVTYQTAFDFTTGNALNTVTQRIFYSDVVSAETRSENLTIDKKDLNEQVFKNFPKAKDHIVNDKLQLHQTETFGLTTRGGNTLQVVLSEPDFLGEIGTNEFTDRITDQAINAVNRMLVAKKS